MYNTLPFPSLSITNYRRTRYLMRLRLRIQGELSIHQIAQFVKRKNKYFYTTLPMSGNSPLQSVFHPSTRSAFSSLFIFLKNFPQGEKLDCYQHFLLRISRMHSFLLTSNICSSIIKRAKAEPPRFYGF